MFLNVETALKSVAGLSESLLALLSSSLSFRFSCLAIQSILGFGPRARLNRLCYIVCAHSGRLVVTLTQHSQTPLSCADSYESKVEPVRNLRTGG